MSATEPRWNELLTLACKHLVGVGLTRKDWTWGGGTVLMLRHEHRLSWDIDLFLADPQYLTYLSPRLNDAIAADVDHYTEQANHLRCFVEGVGEIDYLMAQPVVDLKPERMEITGHGPIQVMSDREILAQKIYYRGPQFTGRDLFDFATVTALRPELLEDEQLKQVADIRSNALAARMGKEDLRDGWDKVKRHPNATVQITFEEARAGLQKWLGVEPDTPRPKPAPGPGYSM
jgi:hypothetical protein